MPFDWLRSWVSPRPPACDSCGAQDIQFDGDGVYCCPWCHWEGGPGLDDRNRQRRHAALRALSEADRTARVVRELALATTLLDAAAQSPLSEARRIATRQTSTFGAHDEQDIPYELTDALGWVLQAYSALEVAAVCLGRPIPPPPAVSPERWTRFDGQIQWDRVLADVDLVWFGIDNGRAEIERLRS